MMQDAYIIAGSRSAVGKATKGTLRDVRPDDLAAQVIRHLVASLPEFDPNLIHDVIVGNASPEAEQGLNVGRLVSLMGLDTEKVPGMTVNRYCSSGLETIAIATAKIRTGMQELIIAGGVLMTATDGNWKAFQNPSSLVKAAGTSGSVLLQQMETSPLVSNEQATVYSPTPFVNWTCKQKVAGRPLTSLTSPTQNTHQSSSLKTQTALSVMRRSPPTLLVAYRLILTTTPKTIPAAPTTSQKAC